MKKIIFCSLALFSFSFNFSQEKVEKKDIEEFEFKENYEKTKGIPRKYTKQEVEEIRNAPHEQKSTNRYFGEIHDEWTCIGPYYFYDRTGVNQHTGSILDVEYKHRTAEDDLYYIRALSANGGLFEKHREKPWRNITKGLTTNIGCFVTHPTDHDFIFVGTGDFRNTRFHGGTGIYYSHDGGESWTPSLMANIPSRVRSIEFRPDDQGYMAAGTSDGLYLSDNYGLSWARQDSFSSNVVTRVFVENTDHSIDTHYDEKVFYFSVQNRGLFRFRNPDSYTQINFPGISNALINHVELGFNPHNSDIVYALIYVDPFTALGFKSTDHCNSWEPCLNLSTSNSFTTGTQYFSNTIAFNPANPQEVIFGNLRMFRSIDGESFAHVATDDYHNDVNKIIPIPNELNAFWVATDGGLFKYTSSPHTMDQTYNNIPILENHDFEISKTTTEPIMIIGAQDNGTVYKNPSGYWMQQSLMFSDGIRVGLNPYSNDTIMGYEGLTTDICNLYFSMNGGLLWETSLDIKGIMQRFSFDSNTHDYRRPTNFYYTNGDDISSSSDFTYWTTTTFPFPPEVMFTPTISSYVFSPSTSNPTQYTLLGGTPNDYLFVKRPTDIVAVNISSIAIEPGVRPIGIKCIYPRDNWFIAFTEGAGSPVMNLNRRITFSQDYGMTFIPYAGNLPSYVTIRDVFINPYNANIGVVATDMGPYVTTDMGVTWALWDLGLNYETYIKELDFVDNVSFDGSITIVASTYGSSIWMRKINAMAPSGSKIGTSKPGKDLNIDLMQPFIGSNGDLQVEYFMDNENEIEIDIYNIMGQKVKVVEKGSKNAGHYYSPVSISGLSSGLYLVNLRTKEGKVLTKKIVLN